MISATWPRASSKAANSTLPPMCSPVPAPQGRWLFGSGPQASRKSFSQWRSASGMASGGPPFAYAATAEGCGLRITGRSMRSIDRFEKLLGSCDGFVVVADYDVRVFVVFPQPQFFPGDAGHEDNDPRPAFLGGVLVKRAL